MKPDSSAFDTDSTTDNAHPATEGQRIPVIEETFTVDREVVELGALRIRKEIHEETRLIEAPLVREVAETRRVDIGRVVDNPMAPWQDGDEWVIPIHEEVLVKQLVLKAELRIRQRREQQVCQQTVILQHEEARVERLNVASGQWEPD